MPIVQNHVHVDARLEDKLLTQFGLEPGEPGGTRTHAGH